MKPIGIENLPVYQKIKRIMEIANFGSKSKLVKSDSNKTLEYSVKAPTGTV